MWELDCKEDWALNKWFFQIMVLEKIPEILMDCKEIKPINPKGKHPWIFIGRTDAKADASILWPLYGRSWLFGKDLDAGKDWGQEEKGAIGNQMVGRRHWLIGHEFEQLQEKEKDRES